MENKTIFEKKFETPVKGDTISISNGITIGALNITDYHVNDCCENVYADFSQVAWYLPELKTKEIHKVEIKSVVDIGIVMFLYTSGYSLTSRIGVLIPCYNSQNGYYSDDLSLKIKEGEVVTEIKLNELDCVVDNID